MNDEQFLVVWIMSFLLYLLIYTFWIPLKTQKKIETWLLSKESDEALNQGLEVIVKSIREQTLQDFEEFMLPRARESLQKFWSGAMGNAAKELGKGEEGSQLSLLHNMTKDLSGQPWYVQAAASKLLPIIENASKTQKVAVDTVSEGMGLRK
ncbi:MAG: hypothetical protein [Circular genetic element sp.]|nr:MAG: hypothetical protein [Circular genetic element sp.]